MQAEDHSPVYSTFTSKSLSVQQMNQILSYKLEFLKCPNNSVVKPGVTFEQDYVFINDGEIEWPSDTYFIFAGTDNALMLPEEIQIGTVAPNESIAITVVVTVPQDTQADRFSIDYEFRH